MPISFTPKTWVDYTGAPFLSASEANRWETALDALINGSSRAVYRDGDTITGNLTVNGWIESDQGFRDAGGVTRISATGAGVFSQATVSDVAATHVMFGGTGGRVTGSGALAFDSAGQVLDVGDGLTSAAVVEINADAGGRSSLRFLRAGISRWTLQRFNSDFLLIAQDAAGTTIDTPFSFANASGGTLTFGGTTLRPSLFTGTVRANGGYLDGSGVTRVSSAGAGTLASVTAADLTPNLPVYADASKKLATESASAFRSRISAALDASVAGRVWRTKVTTSTLYSEVRYNPVAYGNGVWVQVMGDISAGSTVARRSTDDGVTWTEIVLPTAARWYGLTWCTGSSLFVLIGGHSSGSGAGVILTSPDGTTWTSRTNTLSYPYAVAANGSTVIVACNGGGVQGRSTDGGVTWSTFASPGGYSMQRAIYAGGRFLLSGSSGSASSADGTTWSNAANPASFGTILSTQQIAFFNGRWWMGVSVSGSGALYTSTNGHTWTDASALTGWFVDATVTNWCSMSFSGNAMIAHVELSSGDNGVLVTVDGVWWDLARNYGNSLGNVAQQGGQFYAFGYRASTRGFTAMAQA